MFRGDNLGAMYGIPVQEMDELRMQVDLHSGMCKKLVTPPKLVTRPNLMGPGRKPC